MTFKLRVKPENCVWMEDTILKNISICFPEVLLLIGLIRKYHIIIKIMGFVPIAILQERKTHLFVCHKINLCLVFRSIVGTVKI